MQSLRRLILSNRYLAGFALALALAVKLLSPAGFMPAQHDGQLVISLCTPDGPATTVVTIPGKGKGEGTGGDSHNGKTEPPCAFSGLASSSLAATDIILLAAAILFAMALALRLPVPLLAAPPAYLRPPLRGPPAI